MWALALVAFTLLAQTSGASTPAKQAYQTDLIRKLEQLRPKTLTAYAGYAGPWIEDFFFTHFTSDPSLNARLERVYVPIRFTDTLLQGMADNVTQALQELDRSFSYFVVVQLDLGLGERHPEYKVKVPADLDVVGFMAGGCSVCDNFRHLVPIPLLKQELVPSQPPPAIEHNVMFQGSATHGIRKLFIQEYGHTYTVLGRTTGDAWKASIQRSNFTLAPRGYGETSFRLFEVIQLGSIPIYIWQGAKWLPFEDLLDWRKFALVLSGHEMVHGGLKHRIDALQHKVPAMKQELARVRHMFTYNFTAHYIVDTLTKHFNPHPPGGPLGSPLAWMGGGGAA